MFKIEAEAIDDISIMFEKMYLPEMESIASTFYFFQYFFFLIDNPKF